MKLILESWRKYCTQERILEGLLREFDRNDRESLMSIGEQFTISYEIELESYDPIGEDGEGPLNLERARNYLGHDYFSESAYEGDADNILQYSLNIEDVEDLTSYYLEHELECPVSCGNNQQQAFLATVAIEDEPKFGDSVLNFLSGTREGSNANPLFTSYFINTLGLDQLKQLGLEIYEDKQTEMPFEEDIEWGPGQGRPAAWGHRLGRRKPHRSRSQPGLLWSHPRHKRPFIRAIQDGHEIARVTQHEDGKYEVDSNLEKLPQTETYSSGAKAPLLFNTFSEAKAAIEAAVRKPVFRSRNLPGFVSKYFFNFTNPEKLKFDLEDFPDMGLFDILKQMGTLDDEKNSLAEELERIADAALDNIINPGRYASVSDIISGYGYKKEEQPILYAVQTKLSSDVEEKVDEQIEEAYQEYQDDPIDYLDQFGIDTDEEFRTELEAENYEETLRKHFPNFMREYGDKLKYESDGSLTNGVEFSMNNPLYLTGLDEAFRFLRLFFEDYDNQSNFSFDDNTGLHTNIGFLQNAGEEQETKTFLNLMKGLLFLNDDFAKKGFESRKNSRWAKNIKAIASKYISDRSDDKSTSRYMDLLRSRRGIEELSGILSSEVMKAAQMTGPKTLGMNITYINRLNYIEFRYPGNVDPTYDRMVDATLYYSHIVRTVFDETYKRKEYIQKLAGFLSNLEDYTTPDESESLRKFKGMMLAGIGTVYSYDKRLPGRNPLKATIWEAKALAAFLLNKIYGPIPPEEQAAIDDPDNSTANMSLLHRKKESYMYTWKSAIGSSMGSYNIPVLYGGLKRINKGEKKSKKDYVVVFYHPLIEGIGGPHSLARIHAKFPMEVVEGPDVQLTFERHEVPLLQLLSGKINNYHLIDAALVQATEGSEEEQKRNNILTLMGYTSSKEELEESPFAIGKVAEMISYLKQEFRKFRR